MFNDRLSSEEANQRIKQRIKEAEIYSLHKQLGYRDHAAAKWIFALIILLIAVAIGVH